MISPSVKLYRLRGIFAVYFVLKSIAGAVVAMLLLKPFQNGDFERSGWRGLSSGALLFFSLTVAAVILVIALLVFAQLLLRKNWARVLLLVLGWLAVISAFFGLLMSPQLSDPSSWLGRIVAGLDLDWKRLLAYDRIQKIFELLFWGYLIFVLQFDASVRNEFCSQAVEGGQEPS